MANVPAVSESGFVPAPIPANEAERIAALRALDILDSAEEDIYNSIAKAAADVCQTPMASLTFIDSDRQWFKARVGLVEHETARDISFCGHAIHGADLMIVSDALQDPRFRNNPLVQGNPNLRFYAGMPLVTEAGLSLGTLCVLDTIPRTLGRPQTQALTALAASALRVLELRKNLGVAVFAKAVDMTSDGVTIADASDGAMTIMYANESFLNFTGFAYVDVINQPPTFPLDSGCPPADAAFFEAANNGQMKTVECEFRRKDGQTRWTRVSFVPYVDARHKLIYLVCVHRDVTAIREADTQSQQLYAMRTTIASIEHVVKNFLNSAQMYSSYVNSTAPVEASIQRSFDAALENTKSRLTAIARMSSFKDRATPFGFAMLDTDEDK